MSEPFYLDTADATPLYLQLYRHLRRQVLDCVYHKGDAIPSETTLQREHGITRGTVRHAISLLVADGLVETVRGKGNLVSYTEIAHSVWNFGSFTDFTRSRGQKPVTRVCEREIIEQAGQPALRLVRARGIEVRDQVDFINLDTSWLSLECFPGLDEIDHERESLYRVLRERYGTTPAWSEMVLSVVQWTPLAVETFGTYPDVPGLLRVEGQVFTAEGHLVERTSVLYSPNAIMNIATTINRAAGMPTG